MGPSGSGKSTVMNILGGLDTPTGGSYLFRGVHVERLTRRERALLRRHYLGFVFQGFNLLARTSALENVELPLLYRGEPAPVRRKAALEALEAVGLPGGSAYPGRAFRRPAAARRHRRAILTRRTSCRPTSPRGTSKRSAAGGILNISAF
jgi:putative ABC transport system ATP-binding protein